MDFQHLTLVTPLFSDVHWHLEKGRDLLHTLVAALTY